MSLFDLVGDQKPDNIIQGVVIAIVTNNLDPEKLGRVKVKFPWLSSDHESNWARIAVMMAGKDKGTFYLPDVNDEVLVAFEHGNINAPYVIGCLWNGMDTPPETNADGKNNIKMIKSRSGHIVKLDDSDGNEKIEIIDKAANNKIIFDTSKSTLTIESNGDIEMNAPNGKITIKARQLEISSLTSAKIEGSTNIDLSATGTLNLKGSMVNIN